MNLLIYFRIGVPIITSLNYCIFIDKISFYNGSVDLHGLTTGVVMEAKDLLLSRKSFC